MKRRDLLRMTATGTAIGLAGLVFPVGASAVRHIVFIHGRDQQGRDPEMLKSSWLEALRRGANSLGRTLPDDLDVTFPFYGDVLDRFANDFDIPLTSEIQARGQVDEEFLVFQAEFAESIRQQAGITDAEVDAEYGNNPNPRGPLNWQWVQATLRAIDKNSSGMSQGALERFTRDVFLYVTRAGLRDAIDQIVIDKLSDQPTLIVSHSLGTVVAYSVLRRDQSTGHVPLLVTLGSPLAVRSVRDQFRPLGYPVSVSDWYNAFDTRDVVSLYPLDGANFPVSGTIENNSTVRNHTDNRHGIDGYLDDTNVARRILDGLGS
ncbi:hypothetical protein PS850_01218 [Pseudomonas fluorescens]|nr:hypothetical protein PS850_01218 [Pseudomonas fluorescens]